MELTDLISMLKGYMAFIGYFLMIANFYFSFTSKNNTDIQNYISYGTIGCLWMIPTVIPYFFMMINSNLKEFKYPSFQVESGITVISLLLGILIFLNHKNNIKSS